jgi:hypothetical protein
VLTKMVEPGNFEWLLSFGTSCSACVLVLSIIVSFHIKFSRH